MQHVGRKKFEILGENVLFSWAISFWFLGSHKFDLNLLAILQQRNKSGLNNFTSDMKIEKINDK